MCIHSKIKKINKTMTIPNNKIINKQFSITSIEMKGLMKKKKLFFNTKITICILLYRV